jgi:hypothetical protein
MDMSGQVKDLRLYAIYYRPEHPPISIPGADGPNAKVVLGEQIADLCFCRRDLTLPQSLMSLTL